MYTETLVYTLLYLLLATFIIYPPVEFITSGITVTSIFSSFLGSENERFVLYHIKRSNLNLFIYSLLPIGYVFGLWIFNYNEEIFTVWNYKSLGWQLFTHSCLILPLLALYQIYNWSWENWKNHPIAVNISKFCNNNSNWQTVASDIDIEYRRFEKICINTNPLYTIVATENWIIKVTPFTLFVAHQSDATLEVNRSDMHEMALTDPGQAQYVNIEIKSARENVQPFTVRLNALDFVDLQDHIARTITILPNIKFHITLMDKFVDTFKELVIENPSYVTNQELENCVGCMQAIANVKLQKLCVNEDASEKCVTCYCRPMWCIECMARWFASRQSTTHPETWLSSKCTCPVCRAKFCILDVCPIADVNT